MEKNLIIGVDVGGTNIRCAVISRSRGIIKYKESRIGNKNSQEKIINLLMDLLDTMFSSQIRGIGIGVAAIVNTKEGTIYEATNLPGLKNASFKKILEKKYKVPILVNNDANCFVLGEKFFESAKRFDHIVGVIIGTGFGAGIIIDGKLYCGHNCAAGEFGRVAFQDGNIEDYCSGKFFERRYNTSGEDLYTMAKKHEKMALSAFREYGNNLGIAIATVINSLDPEIIVLGGSVSKSYIFFKTSFLTTLKEYTSKYVYKKLKVKASRLNGIGVLGAAALFYEQETKR